MKRTFMLGMLLVSSMTATIALAQTSGSAAVESSKTGSLVLVNRDKDGLALQGYDAVAYFEVGKPVKGDAAFRTRHGGAIYQFASKRHQEMFEADPEKYTPQYGGYCGYAASIDKLSPVIPEWFQVLDGRLILQHNEKAWNLWNKDLEGNIVKADANWPGLVARNGAADQAKQLLNLDSAGLALQGYDPVAYFTEHRALRGQDSIEAVYGGGKYHFASVENKDTFERDPSRYAPAFGGFCAYAASIDKVSPVDPEIFQIENGRLMLQHTQKAYDLFNKDVSASIGRADRNWPGLVAKHGA